ncbi:hypothetical protein NB037_14090 [Rathayibacter sp. ZW T2_19]|uniref:Uncharacterized protein n=1 Tax=Rathayibacter rubneri TaxID=2950106 RepID=A0A9X2DYR4_9MICO|nr:hypothetical protein [Rathayibacter rubneri]MCM6763550.1 hypothetical protein [Rathayibacter rubneri]
MSSLPTATGTDRVGTALSVLGVVGAAVCGIVGAVGAVLSLLAFAACTATYRGFLLARNDPPIDCLARPEYGFVWWFLLVGAGAAGSFLALVLGARPRWDGRSSRALAQGAAAFLVLGAITVVGAIAGLPLR